MIVHVDTDPGWRGGQQLLHRLALGLVQRGWPTAVACPPAGLLFQKLRAAGVSTIAIPPGNRVQTARLLSRLPATLLVAHTSHAHGLCLLVPRLPLLVVRWVDAPVRSTPWSLWKYRRVGQYVACSAAVSDVLADAGVSRARISVVYGGTDVSLPASAAPDAPAVLAVGARVHHKGHDVLAAAVSRLRAEGLALDVGVAGTGPLSFPGLRYLGERADIPALLAGARLFVHPSRSEGLGMAVVEAMMAGVPVLASRVGGIPEIVQQDGILLPPGDVDAWTHAIRAAWHQPPPTQGKARVQAHFSTDAMVMGFDGVFRRMGLRPESPG